MTFGFLDTSTEAAVSLYAYFFLNKTIDHMSHKIKIYLFMYIIYIDMQVSKIILLIHILYIL